MYEREYLCRESPIALFPSGNVASDFRIKPKTPKRLQDRWTMLSV
jgi:hypothetical protein